MKEHLVDLLEKSLASLKKENALPSELEAKILIERTKDKAHGDYATNLAMLLTKAAKKKPRDLAQAIIDHLPESEQVIKVEIAGPGFINFYLNEAAGYAVIHEVIEQADHFGESNFGQKEKVHVEFVSANPTGPLHVGHGRGASYGAAMSNLLTAVGYQVHREYYVNDAGRQMHILAASIWLRYLELCGERFSFPSNGYKGSYVSDLAKSLFELSERKFYTTNKEVFLNVPDDETAENPEGDKDAHIDAIVENAQRFLGKENYTFLFQHGLNAVLGDIKEDLAEYGVVYQEWFSEQSLTDQGLVQHALKKLADLGYTYEKEGALWFRATEFGDDKDRVLSRKDGRMTYFAADVAYHLSKVERGYHRIIDVLGADHHGYVTRVRAAMRALGVDDAHFQTPLVQFATLYRQGEKVQMSTRGGEFVTLRELRKEIGKDAARFFYTMRKANQHMDFDLDLAKSTSSDNPVYYIQYAYARICSVFRQAKEKSIVIDIKVGLKHLSLLSNQHEKKLLDTLSRYTEILHAAAVNLEPHNLTNYLRDLAADLHAYYNSEQFLVSEEQLCQARLCFVYAVRQVLANGLRLLDLSTPEKM